MYTIILTSRGTPLRSPSMYVRCLSVWMNAATKTKFLCFFLYEGRFLCFFLYEGCRSSRRLNTASRPPNTVTLTVLKETMEWERYLNQFQYLWLCETLLPQNLGRDCLKSPAGQTDSENTLFIQENQKPQDLKQIILFMYTDGSATKDQSGWGSRLSLVLYSRIVKPFDYWSYS